MIYYPIVLQTLVKEYQETRLREANTNRLVRRRTPRMSARAALWKRIFTTGQRLGFGAGRRPTDPDTSYGVNEVEGFSV